MPRHPGHEHEQSKDDHLVKGVVIGTVIGAGLLYLLGSETGKKLRQQLLDEGEKLVGKIKPPANEMTDEDDYGVGEAEELMAMEPEYEEDIEDTPPAPSTTVVATPVVSSRLKKTIRRKVAAKTTKTSTRKTASIKASPTLTTKAPSTPTTKRFFKKKK